MYIVYKFNTKKKTATDGNNSFYLILDEEFLTIHFDEHFLPF